jgi:hypothetical protein
MSQAPSMLQQLHVALLAAVLPKTAEPQPDPSSSSSLSRTPAADGSLTGAVASTGGPPSSPGAPPSAPGTPALRRLATCASIRSRRRSTATARLGDPHARKLVGLASSGCYMAARHGRSTCSHGLRPAVSSPDIHCVGIARGAERQRSWY